MMTVIHTVHRQRRLRAGQHDWLIGAGLRRSRLLAEIERSLFSARTKEGLSRRKAEGVKRGRPASSRSRTSKLPGKAHGMRNEI